MAVHRGQRADGKGMARALKLRRVVGLILLVALAHWAALQVLWAYGGALAGSLIKPMATPFFTRELRSGPVPPKPMPIKPGAVLKKDEKKPPFKKALPAVIASSEQLKIIATESIKTGELVLPTLAELTLAGEAPSVMPVVTPTVVVSGAASGAVRGVIPPVMSPMAGLTAPAAVAVAAQTGDPKSDPKVDSALGPAGEPIPSFGDWPPDTRLSYVLSGNFRGPIFGTAKVQWQRTGNKYQAKVDMDLTGLPIYSSMTSQGRVTAQGLAPSAYEERRPGGVLQTTFEASHIRLNDGTKVERPAGLPEEIQDTASQFVELGHRFATGRAVLEVGKSVNFWLARPNFVSEWTYDVVAEDAVDSPRLGKFSSFHLKPRPLAKPNGPVSAEMWFAPSLQYLPVRIKITLGEQVWVDLHIEKIEQANASQTAP